MQRGRLALIAHVQREVLRLSLIHIWHQAEAEQLVYEMPIGGFSFAGGVRPTCGMAAHDHSFNMDDSPAAFFHPHRFQAGILWMREGFVEYAFPPVGSAENLESIEFSFEACSEAPCYRNDWPRDIYVCVNGVQIGVWHCPGDFGAVSYTHLWSESGGRHEQRRQAQGRARRCGAQGLSA